MFTTTAPLVSVGIGAGVDGWRSASTPVDNSGPGVAGFVPYATMDFVCGGYGPTDFRSAIPSVLGGAIPAAGFPDPGGAPQGIAGLARGTRPVIGSRVPAPPGGGAPPPGGPGAGIGTASSGQHRKVLIF